LSPDFCQQTLRSSLGSSIDVRVIPAQFSGARVSE
jgi:hypothetical protein